MNILNFDIEPILIFGLVFMLVIAILIYGSKDDNHKLS
jgi:hypothetical protein